MLEHKIRVSSKGQVVIPEEIRIKYKISTGTELTLKPLDENRLVIERVPKLSELFGFLGKTNATTFLERDRDAEVKSERERDEELRPGLRPAQNKRKK